MKNNTIFYPYSTRNLEDIEWECKDPSHPCKIHLCMHTHHFDESHSLRREDNMFLSSYLEIIPQHNHMYR